MELDPDVPSRYPRFRECSIDAGLSDDLLPLHSSSSLIEGVDIPLQTLLSPLIPSPPSLAQSHSELLAVPGTLNMDVNPFTSLPIGFSL